MRADVFPPYGVKILIASVAHADADRAGVCAKMTITVCRKNDYNCLCT